MKLRANQYGHLQVHRPATPVLIGSQSIVPEGRRSTRSAGSPRGVRVSWLALRSHVQETAHVSSQCPNLALNLAHFVRWTLRDKAAQRRLALR